MLRIGQVNNNLKKINQFKINRFVNNKKEFKKNK